MADNGRLWQLRGRWILIPIIAQLLNRGRVLGDQPFPVAEVPALLWILFIVGAAVLCVAFVVTAWSPVMYAAAAVAVGAPYIAYATWVASSRDLSGIAGATIGDLVLIPLIVGMSWGRVVPVRPVDDDREQ